MQLLTIDELVEKTQILITLPAGLSVFGGQREVLVRSIGNTEYQCLLPPPPPESATWSKDEWPTKLAAWEETLPLAEQRARRLAKHVEVPALIVAAACLSPKLSYEQALRLGDDVSIVAVEVLKFSGVIKVPPETAKAAEPATSEPAAVAA